MEPLLFNLALGGYGYARLYIFILIVFITAETRRTQRIELLLLSADPGGIGSAFHRAGRAESNKFQPFG